MIHVLVTLRLLAQAAGRRLTGEDRGATAVEYGLMVALIAVAIILTVGVLGTRLSAMFQAVCDALPGTGTC